MKGFYSLWTAPYRLEHPGITYEMNDYELLMLMLSSAVYERTNGNTKLYADEAAYDFICNCGLEDLFSDGIKMLPEPEGIDPGMFWAAGKLTALKAEKMPSVMIDTDLIIWRDISYELSHSEIAVIHDEDLNPSIYPDPYLFSMKEGYSYPEGMDTGIRPVNTALLYIEDEAFKERYVSEALEFMRMCKKCDDRLNRMVFAEQRMLSICAAIEGKRIYTFCDDPGKLREQKIFTHFWGHKNLYRFNAGERNAGCMRMMQRLKNEYPRVYKKAAGINMLKSYL